LRVLIDASVLINVLLSPDPRRSAAVALLVEAERGSFSLAIPVETIAEIERVTIESPWIAQRVLPDTVEQLVALLRRIAHMAPSLGTSPPRVGRDPGDDYLLAQALLAQVDILVSRDNDLLDLDAPANLRIVDPVTLLGLVREE
jgi:putative PIN family toxin of toxin-antitoxin system